MPQEAFPRHGREGRQETAPPPDPAQIEADLDSGVADRTFRALLSLYARPGRDHSAGELLDRFANFPDPRVRMAAVDYAFAEAVHGASDPPGAETLRLQSLLERFSEDHYVVRCLLNRAVQHQLAGTAPDILALVPRSAHPEWLLQAYASLHPVHGYTPLCEMVLKYPGAPWTEEAVKHLYRLDPASAVRDFPDHLPSLPDRKLWRVLEGLAPEFNADYVPLLKRFVAERDARVRRVCVAVLRWLAGREEAQASFRDLPLTQEERQELTSITEGTRRGAGMRRREGDQPG